jgi:phenylpropionate dioxygenase-like ring-hydroxylating dioxygenase large terminal subunit
MIEPVLWNDWHAVIERTRLARLRSAQIRLFGECVYLHQNPGDGILTARCSDSPVHVRAKYGYVWVSLGKPAREIIDLTHCDDEDRMTATAGSTRVAVSGLRAVENFLDLGHLPFVHAGLLGERPLTEISPYTVESCEECLRVRGCRIYQPKASPLAANGYEVEYEYAVLRPNVVVLYKANPLERQRKDLIALFAQPETEESCVAHMLTSFLKNGLDPVAVRHFQRLIFGQDRAILENQFPKRLPLAPQHEIHTRADLASSTYRRWLMQSGVRFGALAG